MAKGMAKLLKEAQKFEKRAAQAREALREMRIEGTAGGGIVRVVMNGHRDVLDVHIAEEAIEGGDMEMLEDLLLAALRDAKQKSDELAAKEMAKVAGGMPLPGL